MEVTFSTSEKGKSLLVIDGYTFSFHKMLVKDTVKRWQCSKRTCKAFVKTQTAEDTVVESVLDHNHEKLEPAVFNRKVVSNSLKRKAISDICEKPIKLIRSEINNTGIDTFTTKDIVRVRQNIYNARASALIKLPKNISDFHAAIESTPILTNKNECFLLKNDKENNIVIFSCFSNLKFLSSTSSWYVDGTFEYCPRFFTQLFTILGLKNGYYIPLVFCLLPNKTSLSYYQVFKYIKEECDELNLSISPKIITADFETAIHKSIYHAFPEVVVRGCRFHLGQSWYRKIQQLGLSAEYQKKNGNETEITNFLTYIFGLPFLHPEDVGEVFAFDLAEIKPENEKLTEFCDYLVDNYIGENSHFPPHIWAEHSPSLQRTTNACESFHSKYNSSFYSAHPNINYFLNVLLQFQIDSSIKINSVFLTPRATDSRSLIKQKFLNEKLIELKNHKINKFEFVKAVSYRFRALI